MIHSTKPTSEFTHGGFENSVKNISQVSAVVPSHLHRIMIGIMLRVGVDLISYVSILRSSTFSRLTLKLVSTGIS